MIRVSAPVHSGSPAFTKHDSIGLSTSIGKGNGGGGHSNGKQAWLRKQLYKCNGYPVVDNGSTANNSSSPYHLNHHHHHHQQSNSATTPIRSTHAQHHNKQNRFSPNPKSANHSSHRSLPFTKEMQINLNKLEFDKLVKGGSEEQAANLFAGSKSCVTPSPAELPKPPRNWTNASLMNSSGKQVDNSVLSTAAATAAPLDLTHDSAVLAVGTEKEHLLKLKLTI